MLERICGASGVSGNEDEVRDLLKDMCKDYSTETDVMGNLLVETGGNGKKILLAAHMDEVGFIISGIEDNGFLRFKTVGGIDIGVIIGKRVIIGDKKVPGIIGIKAVHLQKKDDSAPAEDELYIDIGAENKDEASAVVNLGDYASFEPLFVKFGNNLLASKALDDRAGCAVLTEELKRNAGKNLCLAFTAQEEVGCRGAAIAAERFQPDVALVVETTICQDVFPTNLNKTPTKLGEGPVLTFLDRTSVPDREVIESLTETARKHKIPFQYKKTNMGGTDAGSISRAAEGIPTAIVALPCRNLHSPVTVISLDDYNNLIKLIDLWLKDIG
ncbi:MAG: M20/M25/M40 family metallo-hydrolase [Clostridia bacterium]|nr:M20/M25/M40 family metallo-hydrolase [Clostridia bacterium]